MAKRMWVTSNEHVPVISMRTHFNATHTNDEIKGIVCFRFSCNALFFCTDFIRTLCSKQCVEFGCEGCFHWNYCNSQLTIY